MCFFVSWLELVIRRALTFLNMAVVGVEALCSHGLCMLLAVLFILALEEPARCLVGANVLLSGWVCSFQSGFQIFRC